MIEFKNVSKTYDRNTEALENVDLTVNDGEFVFIIGDSGAGKTTFAKLLIKEEKPTSGSITVDGRDLRRVGVFRLPRYRRKIGFVFQDFRLFSDMTVYENVAFAMRAVGKTRKEIAHKVPLILKVFGLEGKRDRFPSSLSGGEQQRVAIARALANNPKYIIADEPTGNIDPEKSKETMELLLSIHKMGKTVIVVTHEQELIARYGKRTVTLSGGRIVADTAWGKNAPAGEGGAK